MAISKVEENVHSSNDRFAVHIMGAVKISFFSDKSVLFTFVSFVGVKVSKAVASVKAIVGFVVIVYPAKNGKPAVGLLALGTDPQGSAGDGSCSARLPTGEGLLSSKTELIKWSLNIFATAELSLCKFLVYVLCCHVSSRRTLRFHSWLVPFLIFDQYISIIF